MEHLFRVIYFAGMVAEAILRKPYVQQRRGMAIAEKKVTTFERIMPTGLTLAMGLLPLLRAVTPWLDFADLRLSARARVGAGLAGGTLLVAAVWLFGRAHRDLGANWSPTLELRGEHTLVTGGVYGVVRHPMYTSQLLYGLAQLLLLPNWIAGLGGLVMFLPMYFLRVPHEERMMQARFGEEYRAYQARTGGIVPRLPR